MSTGRLAGKVVLVTGSTSGIGEGIVRQAAAEGASLLIHGLDRHAGESVVSSLTAQGIRAALSVGDIADPTVPARVVKECIDTFGRIDCLVNNAGISPRSGLEDTSAEFFDRVMTINARAPMLFIQAAVPHFREAGGGSVVNIGSVNAHAGAARLLPYSMSKGALMTMTRNLSSALGPDHVRVNQLNVGWTLTENEKALARADGRSDDFFATMDPKIIPLGRMILPKDVAMMVCYLLSEEAAVLSGAVVEFDQANRMGRW